ncbi:MAG TPA: hypothetical protein VF914_01405 [Chloroflexia bacterium]|jgi:hypothetical protein
MRATDTMQKGKTGQRAPSVIKVFKPNMAARKVRSYVFIGLGILSILIALGVLLTLILDVLVRGVPWLDWQFLSSFDSRFAKRAGIKAALFGTAYMMFFTILLSLPLGVMSAIYLEEYSTDSRLNRFIELNISNLAGVPSIIYGLLGLQVFVRWFALERSVLAGSLTMARYLTCKGQVAGAQAGRDFDVEGGDAIEEYYRRAIGAVELKLREMKRDQLLATDEAELLEHLRDTQWALEVIEQDPDRSVTSSPEQTRKRTLEIPLLPREPKL